MAEGPSNVEILGAVGFDLSAITQGFNQVAQQMQTLQTNFQQQFNRIGDSVDRSTKRIRVSLSSAPFQQLANVTQASMSQMTQAVMSMEKNVTEALAGLKQKSNEAGTDIQKSLSLQHIKDFAFAAGHALERLGEGAAHLAKEIVHVGAEFNKFQAMLTTSMKSAEKGKDLLQFVKVMSQETPFEVSALSKGAVIMQAYGQDAKKYMSLVADLSAGMRKEVDYTADAFAKALTGSRMGLRQLRSEFGITNPKLAEFGVKVSKNNEVLLESTADFRNLRTALESIVQRDFGGAAKGMMDTFGGAMSNLKDVITLFMNDVAQMFLPTLTALVKWTSAVIKKFEDLPPILKLIGGVSLGLVAIFGTLAGWLVRWASLLMPAIVSYKVLRDSIAAKAAVQAADTVGITANTEATALNTAAQTTNVEVTGVQAVGALAKLRAGYTALNTAIMASTAATVTGFGILLVGLGYIAMEAYKMTHELSKFQQEKQAEDYERVKAYENYKKNIEGKEIEGLEATKAAIINTNAARAAIITQIKDLDNVEGLSAKRKASLLQMYREELASMTARSQAMQKEVQELTDLLEAEEKLTKDYEYKEKILQHDMAMGYKKTGDALAFYMNQQQDAETILESMRRNKLASQEELRNAELRVLAAQEKVHEYEMKAGSETIAASEKWFSHKKAMQGASLQEERAFYERLLIMAKGNEAEEIRIKEKLFQLDVELNNKRLQHTQNTLKLMLEAQEKYHAHLKNFNQISEAGDVAFYKRALDRLKTFAEKNKAEIAKRPELAKDVAAAIEEAEVNLYNANKALVQKETADKEEAYQKQADAAEKYFTRQQQRIGFTKTMEIDAIKTVLKTFVLSAEERLKWEEKLRLADEARIDAQKKAQADADRKMLDLEGKKYEGKRQDVRTEAKGMRDAGVNPVTVAEFERQSLAEIDKEEIDDKKKADEEKLRQQEETANKSLQRMREQNEQARNAVETLIDDTAARGSKIQEKVAQTYEKEIEDTRKWAKENWQIMLQDADLRESINTRITELTLKAAAVRKKGAKEDIALAKDEVQEIINEAKTAIDEVETKVGLGEAKPEAAPAMKEVEYKKAYDNLKKWEMDHMDLILKDADLERTVTKELADLKKQAALQVRAEEKQAEKDHDKSTDNYLKKAKIAAEGSLAAEIKAIDSALFFFQGSEDKKAALIERRAELELQAAEKSKTLQKKMTDDTYRMHHSETEYKLYQLKQEILEMAKSFNDKVALEKYYLDRKREILNADKAKDAAEKSPAFQGPMTAEDAFKAMNDFMKSPEKKAGGLEDPTKGSKDLAIDFSKLGKEAAGKSATISQDINISGMQITFNEKVLAGGQMTPGTQQKAIDFASSLKADMMPKFDPSALDVYNSPAYTGQSLD